MKKLIPILLLLAACNTSVEIDYEEPKAEDIHALLDDWHKAAANADFEKYFSYFESDSSIFMGTDATERWTVAEFRPWSKPYFDRGKAWSFKATERVIYFSKDRKTSWFDEVLDTPNLGPSRGTGVLTRTLEGWKISHYNLTVPIPNEIVGNVVEQIDSVLNK
ncbi:MAG: nuclear transport factor 2 family protein [Bacteroidota bacterium]